MDSSQFLHEIQRQSQKICKLITQLVSAIHGCSSIDFADNVSRLSQSAIELTDFTKQLNQMQAHSEEQLRDVRHDFRNLLNAVTGYCEMVDEDCEGHPAIQPHTTALLEATSKAQHLFQTTTQTPQHYSATFFNDDKPFAEIPTEPGHLLVIDDKQSNRDILSHYLQKLGHSVSAVSSAKQALEALNQQSFDLILLDLIMPETDGFQLLKQLKADEDKRAIPVIMVSGIDDTEGVIQCIKAGAEDYLTKPFNPILLEARLSACLERKRWHDREISILNELEKRNRFIRHTFGQYLTDEIVNNLLENPDGLDLGGAYRQVTILMTDIRNFTNLCEQMKPERVVKLLNNYLGVMTNVIMDYRGTVDEFIGDAILALFGAPVQREDDTDRAVACAIAMQLAMEEVNSKNRQDGLPEISMGIGINTGEVIAGNIGSDKRLKYAVVGRHVNLTARVESFTKGGQILASQYTIDAMTSPLTITHSESVQLKGIQDKVLIHNIQGISGNYNLALKD